MTGRLFGGIYDAHKKISFLKLKKVLDIFSQINPSLTWATFIPSLNSSLAKIVIPPEYLSCFLFFTLILNHIFSRFHKKYLYHMNSIV